MGEHKSRIKSLTLFNNPGYKGGNNQNMVIIF